jgi:vacuolar-type H+-ATPase subunit I/STV1
LKKKTRFATTTSKESEETRKIKEILGNTRKELERTRKEPEIKLTREEELILAWFKQHASEIRKYVKEVEATSPLG